MPSVSAGSVNVEYQLGLVRDGAIQHFAGYLPGDGDTFVAAVFTDIKPSSKVAKKGLNLTAIPLVPTGSVPEKYAESLRTGSGSRYTYAWSRENAKVARRAHSTWVSGRI